MSAWLDKDHASALVKKATDMLFVRNPHGTSMGVLLGVILSGLTEIFHPLLQRQQIFDFTRVNVVFWIVTGVFIFNLPLLFRRRHLDPTMEAALTSITKAIKEGHLSDTQAKLMYLSLYKRVLAQVTLDKPTEEKIRQIQDSPGGSDITST